MGLTESFDLTMFAGIFNLNRSLLGIIYHNYTGLSFRRILSKNEYLSFLFSALSLV